MAKLKKIIEYLLYLFIFLLPLQTRLIWYDTYLNGYVWEFGRFSLYGTEILLWLILLLYLFWLNRAGQFKSLNFSQVWQQLKNPAVLLYWLIVIFILWSGLSIIWSLNTDLAYNRWLILLEAVALLSLILNLNLKFRSIAIVWVSSAVVQSIFAIWQFFNQFTFANKWLGLAEHLPTVAGSIILQTGGERWLRAYGSLPHPNILGGFLAIGFLFLLYLIFTAKNSAQKVFVWFALLAITPAVFFSFCRSAWLALFCSFSFLAFWIFKTKNQIWIKRFFQTSLLIAVIIGFLIFNFWQPFFGRFISNQQVETASVTLRIAFGYQSWDLVKVNPWFGQGIGNYTLAVFQKINASWPGYYYQPVHNIYLLVLAELGIIGAGIFYLILAAWFWLSFFSRKSKFFQSADLENILLALAFVSALIISLVDHYFWTLYFGVIIFWLIFALNLKQLKRD